MCQNYQNNILDYTDEEISTILNELENEEFQLVNGGTISGKELLNLIKFIAKHQFT